MRIEFDPHKEYEPGNRAHALGTGWETIADRFRMTWRLPAPTNDDASRSS